MPGITGQGTTFNLPNFVGELFAITPADTPFLSAIGGITGGKEVTAKEWEWEGYTLRDADEERQHVEGDEAPEAEERVRFDFTNVVEIHQEAVEISYTKLAAKGQRDGINTADGSNPVANEMAFQVEVALKQVSRDVELGFLKGQYDKPGNNSSPRKTRGILEAISQLPQALTDDGYTPNVIDVNGALTEEAVLDLCQMAWEQGGIAESELATIMVNGWQKRVLTDVFITQHNRTEQTRDVGGVNLQTIETDFGRLNIMLNRHMPKDQLAVVSLDVCHPTFLLVPDKGFLFVEDLAKTGASEKKQLYGEIGLEYGSPLQHGKLTNLSVENPGS